MKRDTILAGAVAMTVGAAGAAMAQSFPGFEIEGFVKLGYGAISGGASDPFASGYVRLDVPFADPRSSSGPFLGVELVAFSNSDLSDTIDYYLPAAYVDLGRGGRLIFGGHRRPSGATRW